MESVGELLRKAREAQGKTLEEVVKITKVSRRTLEALEDDRFSELSAPVYVKGHLRTYARHLGLDEEEVVQKYLRFTQQQEPADLDEWDAVEVEIHHHRQSVGRRWGAIAIAAAVIVVAIVGFSLLGGRDTSDGMPDRVAEDVPLVTSADPTEAAAQDTTIEWHRLQLQAVALERTWISVSVDGTPLADLTLEQGQRREWEAEEWFEVSVGTAEAIEFYLDGQLLGTAGVGRGVVDSLVITEDGMSR